MMDLDSKLAVRAHAVPLKKQCAKNDLLGLFLFLFLYYGQNLKLS